MGILMGFKGKYNTNVNILEHPWKWRMIYAYQNSTVKLSANSSYHVSLADTSNNPSALKKALWFL